MHISTEVTVPRMPVDFPWDNFTQTLRDVIKTHFTSRYVNRNARWDNVCVDVKDWDPRSTKHAGVRIVIILTHTQRPFISDELNGGRTEELLKEIENWFSQWAVLKSQKCEVIYRENTGTSSTVHS